MGRGQAPNTGRHAFLLLSSVRIPAAFRRRELLGGIFVFAFGAEYISQATAMQVRYLGENPFDFGAGADLTRQQKRRTFMHGSLFLLLTLHHLLLYTCFLANAF